ncbi:MafI family immunity protein [Leclercia pneumoniae]|uniref:MafI family immunity protein n=1 Tax=Leclercia pneumoniae TaxID=2815358 RepID=UPI003AF419A6
MFANRIREFGKAFEGRLESFLLEGALDYINFNEELLAFEPYANIFVNMMYSLAKLNMMKP